MWERICRELFRLSDELKARLSDPWNIFLKQDPLAFYNSPSIPLKTCPLVSEKMLTLLTISFNTPFSALYRDYCKSGKLQPKYLSLSGAHKRPDTPRLICASKSQRAPVTERSRLSHYSTTSGVPYVIHTSQHRGSKEWRKSPKNGPLHMAHRPHWQRSMHQLSRHSFHNSNGLT